MITLIAIMIAKVRNIMRAQSSHNPKISLVKDQNYDKLYRLREIISHLISRKWWGQKWKNNNIYGSQIEKLQRS
jgi:hypothetical protein